MGVSSLAARIFDIQRASMVDGPGIRTTVFFYGCNLRCKWCHNPEGIGLRNVSIPKKYRPREITVSALADIVAEDIPFYDDDGGVTCSGGECMLQDEFLLSFLAECKKRGICTAVDTAGNVPFHSFEKILPYTDLFLYDIKCINPELHRHFTAVDNALILENIKRLFSAGANVTVRIPLIPSFNCNEKEISEIKSFLSPFNPVSIEILPYHTLGNGKYTALGIDYTKFDVPDDETVNKMKKIFHGGKL